MQLVCPDKMKKMKKKMMMMMMIIIIIIIIIICTERDATPMRAPLLLFGAGAGVYSCSRFSLALACNTWMDALVGCVDSQVAAEGLLSSAREERGNRMHEERERERERESVCVCARALCLCLSPPGSIFHLLLLLLLLLGDDDTLFFDHFKFYQFRV